MRLDKHLPIPLAPAGDWECPCGHEEPKRAGDAIPVRTIVALREPACPFCGRKYRPEYRRREEAPAA